MGTHFVCFCCASTLMKTHMNAKSGEGGVMLVLPNAEKTVRFFVLTIIPIFRLDY